MVNCALSHALARSLRLALSCMLFCLSTAATALELGRWSVADINTLLQQAQTLSDPGMKIDFISTQFLNTRYKAHTLIGNAQTAEKLVVRFDALDCMTFIETVEALRRAQDFAGFIEHLKQVRYHAAIIDFTERNHFFADWSVNNQPWIQDVTLLVGQGAAQAVNKVLNSQAERTLIPGIPLKPKQIYYIPAARIDAALLSRLRDGDYVGNYAPELGLDVNHVGIVIKHQQQVYFRHANADEGVRKVMDSDFMRYFKKEAGIIIFRPYHG